MCNLGSMDFLIMRNHDYFFIIAIEKICFALDCKVDDVLEFNRNEG